MTAERDDVARGAPPPDPYDLAPKPEELRDFIAAKWRNRECHVCGADDWESGATGGTMWAGWAMRSPGGSWFPLNSMMLFLPVICRNCGDARAISADAVFRWLDTRTAQRGNGRE